MMKSNRAGIILRSWVQPGCVVCGRGQCKSSHSPHGVRACGDCLATWPRSASREGEDDEDGRYAVWKYGGALRRLLVQAKETPYGPQAWALVGAVSERLSGLGISPMDVWVTPPPSFRRRLHGWYFPEFCARKLAQDQGGSYRNLLRRRRKVRDQGDLDGIERRTNLLGGFSAKKTVLHRSIPDSVILFDDVSTTGATMAEATSSLRRIGVKRVRALSIARVD